jgi:hypothetical protein
LVRALAREALADRYSAVPLPIHYRNEHDRERAAADWSADVASRPSRCGLCDKFLDEQAPMTIELREQRTRTLRPEVVGPLEEPRLPHWFAHFHVGCHDIVLRDRERENVWPG